MTMVSTGEISLGGNATSGGLNRSVNIELGRAATATINMNESAVRTLAGVPSGAISMSNFYGKSNRVSLSFTYSVNTANASLNVTSLSGYVAGSSDITITVNSGIYIYSTSTGNAGLALSGGSTGDTITLVNNGFIMGMGAKGGGRNTSGPGNDGGPAISLGFNTTINNTNASAYIGGGGGGGYGAFNGNGGSTNDGGGGGAGGGAGGDAGNPFGSVSGGAGGGIGGGGSNGVFGGAGGKSGSSFSSGGGGGRVFPGSGGGGGSWTNTAAIAGRGGTGGGGGAGGLYSATNGGAGGSSNSAGGSGGSGSGGGGGWGASGGNSGGAGGRAVQLNGRTVTWVSGNTTRVWGAVS